MQEKESQHIELKESWRDDYLKILSTFANTAGGKLYVKRTGFIFILWAAYLCSYAAPPVKVLLLSGSNNHEWQATTPFIEEVYARDGQFRVDITDRPDTVNARMLASYRVVVSNWNAFPEQTGLWNPEAKQALEDFIGNGGGFVCIHAASATHHDWPAYLQITGGRWGAKTHHGAIRKFNVHVSNPNHPITKGLSDFEIRDELWVDLECDPAAETLCASRAEEYAGTPDKSEPVVLVTRYGKGRGFYLVLGHDTEAMSSQGWQTLLLRGTKWAAKMRKL